jgi:hypothetical protein
MDLEAATTRLRHQPAPISPEAKPIAGFRDCLCDVVSTNTIRRRHTRQPMGHPGGTKLMSEANRRPAGDSPGHQPDWGDGLGPVLHRRLEVAVCWALARRAVLDSRELYEESFALSEEFREWLLCLEEHPEILQENLLMVPRSLDPGRRPETDGLLEI